MYFLLTIISTALIFSAGVANKTGESGNTNLEGQIFDFGHVGIDYRVQHHFAFENKTSDTIRIKNTIPLCDCTSAYPLDSIAAPGETVLFNVNFNTKDQYGPINKELIVTTDHDNLDTLHYFYRAIVGQWFESLRPDPTALLFLPKKGPQTIKVPNQKFDKITLSSFSQHDDFFTVTTSSGKAKKGESLTLEVNPKQNLSKGSYKTNITLHINKGDEFQETILTVPVKIVVY